MSNFDQFVDDLKQPDYGTLAERYAIYLALTDDNPPLTFDEWLNR